MINLRFAIEATRSSFCGRFLYSLPIHIRVLLFRANHMTVYTRQVHCLCHVKWHPQVILWGSATPACFSFWSDFNPFPYCTHTQVTVADYQHSSACSCDSTAERSVLNSRMSTIASVLDVPNFIRMEVHIRLADSVATQLPLPSHVQPKYTN